MRLVDKGRAINAASNAHIDNSSSPIDRPQHAIDVATVQAATQKLNTAVRIAFAGKLPTAKGLALALRVYKTMARDLARSPYTTLSESTRNSLRRCLHEKYDEIIARVIASDSGSATPEVLKVLPKKPPKRLTDG